MCIYRKKKPQVTPSNFKSKKNSKIGTFMSRLLKIRRVIKRTKTIKKMIPFIKKTERKRKPMLFQILLSPYYSHSLFLLLKACPLLSLILYSLILSLSLSTQRKQPSCNNLPSERNSMLHKTHKQRKERPTSPLSDRN